LTRRDGYVYRRAVTQKTDCTDSDLPLIAVTASDACISWNGWTKNAAFVTCDYIDAITEAGAHPVLLPAVGTSAACVLERFDGLVLTGGADVEPARYGAQPHERTVPSPRRDESEFALVEVALERDIPMLAICRGLEVLNVALGGSLVQHLPEVVGHDGHLPVPNQFAEHAVILTRGDGASTVERVHSYHHQAVERLGEGLSVWACALDGTIEGVRDGDASWVYGVQWHPEAGQDRWLFSGLVEAARGRARRRGRNAGVHA
jgi:putative glutamine amidotransferase